MSKGKYPTPHRLKTGHNVNIALTPDDARHFRVIAEAYHHAFPEHVYNCSSVLRWALSLASERLHLVGGITAQNVGALEERLANVEAFLSGLEQAAEQATEEVAEGLFAFDFGEMEVQ